MPRTITINEKPNPTGLSMSDRQLALDVLQSMESSVQALRKERMSWPWRKDKRDWTGEDEQELRRQVYRSAYSQLSGRQKSERGPFTLTTGTIPDDDMEYVMASLGVS